jgi:hypothetical protein
MTLTKIIQERKKYRLPYFAVSDFQYGIIVLIIGDSCSCQRTSLGKSKSSFNSPLNLLVLPVFVKFVWEIKPSMHAEVMLEDIRTDCKK